MRDIFAQLEALDEVSRKQIILDPEFSEIFPEYHNHKMDTASIEHFQPVKVWDVSIVIYFVIGVIAIFMHYA